MIPNSSELPFYYNLLYKRTLMSKYADAELGILDYYPMSEDQKLSILFKVVNFRKKIQ